MNVTTYRFALRTAHLEPMTGVGLMVLPYPAHDLGTEFYAAAWQADLRDLHAHAGYVPDHEGDGVPVVEGHLPDGRAVIVLLGPSIIVEPSLDEMGAASAALRAVAGMY